MNKLFIILLFSLMIISCEEDKEITKAPEPSNKWKVTLLDADVSYSKIAVSDNYIYCYGVKINPDLSDTYYLIKSKDLGGSWERINTVINDQNRYRGWLEMSFYNDNIGYISGDRTLYRTMDGGVSWEDISASSLNFKLLAHENKLFAYYGPLRYSEDLGKNWITVNQPKDAWSVSFINKDQGFASSMNGFYETMDGGVTWNLKSKPAETFDLMSFIDDKNGIATSRHQASPRFTPEKLINITMDGGLNWQIIKLDSIAKGKLGLETRVACKSPDEMYVAGGGGIYLTSDNGISWKQEEIEGYNDISINDIKIIKGKIIAVGYGGLVLTK